MIYFDDFETWGCSFDSLICNLIGREAIDHLALSSPEFIEDAGDFVASHTDISSISAEIHGWLINNEFCIFHGTRLLSEEILSVQKSGLLPLVALRREDRLRQILQSHPDWNSAEPNLLKTLEDLGPKGRAGRREQQVHFSLSRSGLVNGFRHYLDYGSEFDQHVVQQMFEDKSGLELLHAKTIPILVHVGISGAELIESAHPYSSYSEVVGMGEMPGLARTFLNSWAYKIANPSLNIESLRTDCCMMQRAATPPERILSIEHLDEKTEY